MESMLDLKVIISEHFQAGRSDAATIVVKNAKKNQVKEQAWDLVPTVCEYVTAAQNEENPDLIVSCEEILNHLASVANVKELLLVLLEQADTFKDDIKFKVLLSPIQKCLLTLPGSKASSVGIALETLYAHVKGLTLPVDQPLEGQERIFLDLDDDVKRCNDIVRAYLKFLEPIVAQVSWKLGHHEARRTQSKLVLELTRYIVKVLDHPLAYLDLTYRKQKPDEKEPPPKSGGRLCAESALAMLGHLQANIPSSVLSLLEENDQLERKREIIDKKRRQSEKSGENFDELEHYNVDDIVPLSGLSVFCYLAFGENLGGESIPQVYTAEYLLELNAIFSTHLLNQEENLLIHKGLLLLSELQKPVPECTFSGLILEAGEVKDLIHVLIKVMTTAKVKELGQIAVQLLKNLLKKFDLEGRNRFLFYIKNTSHHSGLSGYVTNLMKDEIDTNLRLESPDANFVGAPLWRLLNMVFSLPAGDRTDLLDNVDQIMSALNMLRYLIIRDKPQDNITGVWDHITHIQDKYCEILHKAINLSRVHYELELKKAKESVKKSATSNMSFNVGGQEMAGMNKEQEVYAMQMALHTFDMMESIMGRITELVDQQQHKGAAVANVSETPSTSSESN